MEKRGASRRTILAGLIKSFGGGAKVIPAAHLAVLAKEHGLTVRSADGDFARTHGARLSPKRI